MEEERYAHCVGMGCGRDAWSPWAERCRAGIKAGKVRALATSGAKRAAALPELPTIAEAGVPGFEVNVWYGLFAPRGTPAKLVSTIAADVARIVRAPEMKQRLAALGVEAEGTTPAEFKAYFRADVEKWAKVVKASGAKAE